MIKEKRITDFIKEMPSLYHLQSKKVTRDLKAVYSNEYPIVMICLALEIGRSLGVKMNSYKIRGFYRSIFTNQCTDKAIKTGIEANYFYSEPVDKRSNQLILLPKGIEAIRKYHDLTHERSKRAYLKLFT